MTKLELDGWIVKEGSDLENKLFFYSYKPVQTACNEFSVGKEGDNVFEIELPIRTFVTLNEPQRCKITVDLEK